MGMKFLEVAADNCGGLAELHRRITRRGVNVTLDALAKAIREKRRGMNLGVQSAVVEVAFNGDWEKAGKLIKQEFLPKKFLD